MGMTTQNLQAKRIPFNLDGTDFLIMRITQSTVDDTTTIYKGNAIPGSSESDPVWMISKITTSTDGSVSSGFAGGKADFVNRWSERATLTYA